MEDLNPKPNNLAGKNKRFLKNMVETASPGQLIILLLDGAVQWLHMAKTELVKQNESELPNWSNFSHYMRMSGDILTHLQESLNHKESPDFSDKMHSLYDFMKRELIQAHVKKQEDKITIVQNMIKDLKNTWMEALKNHQSALI